ncbi:DoxX family protein [Halalkalicoccus sp. NIPERK01]|uniref:DoxX family protein n=1 Tax=Halalkalicoccus sp. NIPERK01 TaxID=3053469 RepID=UPI00256EC7F7|nr:DoxX family membrane protein [Halalkalicoccus sp. NIPERK01]MDL5363336.1 DoxX family protein [Halalkalicoccus sp. NIPERK01]
MSGTRTTGSGTAGRDPPALLGRLLFGGMLAAAAINSFRGLEGQIAYAESKNIEYAEYLVPFSSGMLAFGSLGIVLWRFPRLATGAVVTFFAAVTPTMHDFWTASGQERQNELNHFIKNGAMLGAALAFLRRASRQS